MRNLPSQCIGNPFEEISHVAWFEAGAVTKPAVERGLDTIERPLLLGAELRLRRRRIRERCGMLLRWVRLGGFTVCLQIIRSLETMHDWDLPTFLMHALRIIWKRTRTRRRSQIEGARDGNYPHKTPFFASLHQLHLWRVLNGPGPICL